MAGCENETFHILSFYFQSDFQLKLIICHIFVTDITQLRNKIAIALQRKVMNYEFLIINYKK
jgi:hypothetical protein